MSIDKINMKYLQSERVRSIQVFLYQEMSKGLYFQTLESNKNQIHFTISLDVRIPDSIAPFIDAR